MEGQTAEAGEHVSIRNLAHEFENHSPITGSATAECAGYSMDAGSVLRANRKRCLESAFGNIPIQATKKKRDSTIAEKGDYAPRRAVLQSVELFCRRLGAVAPRPSRCLLVFSRCPASSPRGSAVALRPSRRPAAQPSSGRAAA